MKKQFIADDGTIFETAAECRAYEDQQSVPDLAEYLERYKEGASRTGARNTLVAFFKWRKEKESETSTNNSTANDFSNDGKTDPGDIGNNEPDDAKSESGDEKKPTGSAARAKAAKK